MSGRNYMNYDNILEKLYMLRERLEWVGHTTYYFQQYGWMFNDLYLINTFINNTVFLASHQNTPGLAECIELSRFMQECNLVWERLQSDYKW